MVIFKTVFTKAAANAAVIVKNSSFIGMFRVRMTDAEVAKYGGCNSFRFVNNTAYLLRVRFGINNEDGAPFRDIMPNSIHNITVEDGITRGYFDVINLNVGNDVPVGQFTYTMSVINQIPEFR